MASLVRWLVGFDLTAIKVLLIAPEASLAAAAKAVLAGETFDLVHAPRLESSFLPALAAGGYDAVVIDVNDATATQAQLASLKTVAPGLPTVVLGERFDPVAAVELVKQGVQDFVLAAEIGMPDRLATAIGCAITRSDQNYYDPLTGLPNRLLLYDRLGHAINHAKRYDERLAVLFFDLDRFKMINDTLGHLAGDRLLKTVAGRLSDGLRNSDTVARLGGDEFVAVVANLAKPVLAGRIAEKTLAQLSEQIRIGNDRFTISPSIGIAVYPTDGENADELIKCADAAMYQAKQQGGNRYMFYRPDMNAESNRRLGLAFALQGAIQRREFALHYQPQIDLVTGNVVSVEALIRWHHPERGLVPPDQFIPLAEEFGLMESLGEWVMQTACRQCRIWRDDGLPAFRVAVNLSAHQFNQDGLPEKILASLNEARLDADCLEVELTESSVMRDPDSTRHMLQGLSDLGVRISVDDFGTGYSSLAYLKRFPLDVLKIDRSFVNDITEDPNDAAIVKTIIALAENLNLQVVAEGVETRQQMDFLRRHNCRLAQGYYFGRPVPADELPSLLRQIEAARAA